MGIWRVGRFSMRNFRGYPSWTLLSLTILTTQNVFGFRDELCISSSSFWSYFPSEIIHTCSSWWCDVETRLISFRFFISFPTGSSSSSSHTNNNRISLPNKDHDSNSINQNFTTKPYFDFSMKRNVTLKVGQTAFLSCRVKQLGDKLVSLSSCFPSICILYIMNYFLYHNPSDIFQSALSSVI